MLFIIAALLFGRMRVFYRARGRFVTYRFYGRSLTFGLKGAAV